MDRRRWGYLGTHATWPVRYYWSFSDGTSSLAAHPRKTFFRDGAYESGSRSPALSGGVADRPCRFEWSDEGSDQRPRGHPFHLPGLRPVLPGVDGPSIRRRWIASGRTIGVAILSSRSDAGGPSYRIRPVDGRCFFLDAQNRCRIHIGDRLRGQAAVCRAFPLAVLKWRGASTRGSVTGARPSSPTPAGPSSSRHAG